MAFVIVQKAKKKNGFKKSSQKVQNFDMFPEKIIQSTEKVIKSKGDVL